MSSTTEIINDRTTWPPGPMESNNEPQEDSQSNAEQTRQAQQPDAEEDAKK